ncbi:MAG: replication initiator protein A [Halothiobacillaceae bacterium]|nr:replication initiator protein A [Halothiobacillaceae bacterium]
MSKHSTNQNQADLFVCEFTSWPAKDDLASMDVPIFSLSKNLDKEIRKYVRGNRTTTIIPSAAGAATVFDKDLLIYAASQIIEALNQNKPISRTLRVVSYDFLTATERGDGGAAFDRILGMLRRLNGTKLETTIPTGLDSVVQTESFSLIESYKILSEKTRRTVKKPAKLGELATTKETVRVLEFEFTLSEWLMNGLRDLQVLTLDRGYFKLSKPIEKRAYEIARKHCGNQPIYKENIDSFGEKIGLSGPRYKVRAAIREVIDCASLPEYHVALDRSKKIDDVIIYTRNNFALSKYLGDKDLYSWFGNLYKSKQGPTSI